MNSNSNTTFRYFVNKLQSLPESSLVPYMLYLHLRKQQHHGNYLRLHLDGSTLSYGSASLDLKKSSRMRLLMMAFLKRTHLRLSKQELAVAIYGDQYFKLSIRARECADHNLIKLVSRSREALGRAFNHVLMGEVNWLTYDTTHKVWQLYQHREISQEAFDD